MEGSGNRLRLHNIYPWRMSLDAAPEMITCALWIRAAERLQIPSDPLVPGPLDIDRPPPPISIGDEVIAEQWLGWWYSLVAPRRRSWQPPGPDLQPADGTPDPLGLAPYPLLAALVTKRWPQARAWQSARLREAIERRIQAPLTETLVVQALERRLGRRVRPFSLEFLLLPVRDYVIRKVDEERYLVPENVYYGPTWTDWLSRLLRSIG
jgi:hypothetical protein